MRQRSSLLPLALAASAVTLVSLPLQEMRLLGFVTGAARPQQQVRERSRVVAFDGPAFTEATTQVADAKARLMDLLEDEMLAQEVLKVEGKPTRGRVDEAIVMLERLNPTEERAAAHGARITLTVGHQRRATWTPLVPGSAASLGCAVLLHCRTTRTCKYMLDLPIEQKTGVSRRGGREMVPSGNTTVDRLWTSTVRCDLFYAEGERWV